MTVKNHFLEDKIIGYSICLFGFFPILPESLKGLPVILFFSSTLFFFLKRKEKGFNYRSFVKLSSLYLISFLSIFYTGSLFFPKNKIETCLALIILPLSFHLIETGKLKNIYNTLFLKFFIYSTSLLSFICIYYYYIHGLFHKELFKVNSFRRVVLEMPIFNDHPIYISLFLGIAILCTFVCFKRSTRPVKLVIISGFLINVFHMFLLSSKGVIIATIVALITLLMLSSINKTLKVVFSLGVIGFFALSIIYFPNIERRFREFTIETTYSQLHITNSSSIRVAIYQCALKKIKENPMLGYGWGVGDKALKSCYKEKSSYLFENNFNSHNQYLGYYLDGGIIALLVLLIFLYQQFKYSLNSKNHLFTSILVLFSMQMLSENILNRQSGIIIFIFLILFFRLLRITNDENSINSNSYD